jgi:hypothetical protein
MAHQSVGCLAIQSCEMAFAVDDRYRTWAWIEAERCKAQVRDLR